MDAARRPKARAAMLGAYTVTITSEARNESRTNSNAKDPTRFPVRIRAAAAALPGLGGRRAVTAAESR